MQIRTFGKNLFAHKSLHIDDISDSVLSQSALLGVFGKTILLGEMCCFGVVFCWSWDFLNLHPLICKGTFGAPKHEIISYFVIFQESP